MLTRNKEFHQCSIILLKVLFYLCMIRKRRTTGSPKSYKRIDKRLTISSTLDNYDSEPDSSMENQGDVQHNFN